MTKNGRVSDRSGSWAIVLIVIDNKAYVSNVGDSRAILSAENGQIIYKLSRDHKPNDIIEKERIEKNGGSVYQSQIIAKPPFSQLYDFNSMWTKVGLFPSKPLKFPTDWEYVLIGPYRVQPGRLSVSRTFGDVEAKSPRLGGIEGIIVWEPEIKEFNIDDSWDCIVLGCDGIFDKLTNSNVMNIVWNTVNKYPGSIHQLSGYWVESILKDSAAKRTLDNITVVVIVFKSLK